MRRREREKESGRVFWGFFTRYINSVQSRNNQQHGNKKKVHRKHTRTHTRVCIKEAIQWVYYYHIKYRCFFYWIHIRIVLYLQIVFFALHFPGAVTNWPTAEIRCTQSVSFCWNEKTAAPVYKRMGIQELTAHRVFAVIGIVIWNPVIILDNPKHSYDHIQFESTGQRKVRCRSVSID